MVENQEVTEAAQPVRVDDAAVGDGVDDFTCNTTDEQPFPVDAGLFSRSAITVGELATHRQLQASLEALEWLERGGSVGGAVDGSARHLRATRRLRHERLRDLLDQPREPR